MITRNGLSFLNEAASGIPNYNKLRELFENIILNCQPNNAKNLWDRFKAALSNDILKYLRIQLHFLITFLMTARFLKHVYIILSKKWKKSTVILPN